MPDRVAAPASGNSGIAYSIKEGVRAMTSETTTARPVETAEQLERDGFTPEQIERLHAARSAYSPCIEQVESNHEWRRLQFLRWLYHHTDYPRG